MSFSNQRDNFNFNNRDLYESNYNHNHSDDSNSSHKWFSVLSSIVPVLALGLAIGVWEYYFSDINVKYDALNLENAYEDPEQWNDI